MARKKRESPTRRPRRRRSTVSPSGRKSRLNPRPENLYPVYADIDRTTGLTKSFGFSSKNVLQAPRSSPLDFLSSIPGRKSYKDYVVVLYSTPGEYGASDTQEDYRKKLSVGDKGSWPAENEKLIDTLAKDSDFSLNRELMAANKDQPLHVGDLSLLREEESYDYLPGIVKKRKELAEKTEKWKGKKDKLAEVYDRLENQVVEGETKRQKDERKKNLESERKAAERSFVVAHRKATQPLIQALNVEYRKVGISRLKKGLTAILDSKIFLAFADRIQGVILVPTGPNVVPVGLAANILGHALSQKFPASPDAIDKWEVFSKRRVAEIGSGEWRDDFQGAPACEGSPKARDAKLVLIPVMLADIAKLWASWYGPAMSSAHAAAQSEYTLADNATPLGENWAEAKDRLALAEKSSKERAKLIKKVFKNTNATYLLGLSRKKIDQLYRAGIGINDGLLKPRAYAQGSIGKVAGAKLSKLLGTSAKAKYIILPVGKPVAPSGKMTFPPTTRGTNLASISGFLSDYLGSSKDNLVAIVDAPESRYDIKSFSRELKKRFVHDRVKTVPGLSPKEAMCQLVTVNGYIGLSESEGQRRFRPGPYLDQFLNQKVAQILCETGAVVDDRYTLEFTSKQLMALVKQTRVANHIFSRKSLLAHAEALEASGLITGDTYGEIEGDSKKFRSYVNYDMLTTDEKGAVNAFYEYAKEHMPGRPDVICTFDATRLDDNVIVDASIVTLWPKMRKGGMLGLASQVFTEKVEFSGLGLLAAKKAASVATAVQKDASKILKVINNKVSGDEAEALGYLSDIVEEMSGIGAPMLMAFVTQVGSGANIPVPLRTPESMGKSFFLTQQHHMRGMGEHTWILTRITENTAQVSSSGGHIQGRAIYDLAQKSEDWFLPEKLWRKLTVIREKDADSYTKKLSLDIEDLSLKESQAAPEEALLIGEEKKSVKAKLEKRKLVINALVKAFGDYPVLSQQIIFLFGSSRSKGDPAVAEARDIGAPTRRSGSSTEGRSPTAVEVRGSFRPGKIGSLYKLIQLLGLDPLRQFKDDTADSTDRQRKQINKADRYKDRPREGREYLLKKSGAKISPSVRKHPAIEDEDEQNIDDYIVTKLNPRHSMARRNRRPRHPRRNPSKNYKRFVSDYLDPNKQYEGANIPGLEGGEELDFEAAPLAFPRSVQSKSSYSPAAIAEQLGEIEGNLIRFLNRRSGGPYNPLNSATLSGQEGLSLTEARGLTRRYRDAAEYRKSTTIPASSALCAANRRPKLRQYEIPRAVYSFPDRTRMDSKVMIWVSPDGATPRVMTLRRNTHIDCDFVAFKGLSDVSVGGLLALALQDTLMWLAQKPSRQRNTTVYIGRVGDQTVYTAWTPGQSLKYSQILTSLADQSRSTKLSNYDARADVAAYFTAAGELESQIDDDPGVPPEENEPVGEPATSDEFEGAPDGSGASFDELIDLGMFADDEVEEGGEENSE